jgi:16S rRNA A1518/A1519 N6-dimethyltransferase RsmA/KsgA/DIM1 with predicted DNA glycosylase/AP lyase activity
MKLPTSRTEDLLNKTGIDPQRRAETLSITEWGTLTEIYCRDFKQS